MSDGDEVPQTKRSKIDSEKEDAEDSMDCSSKEPSSDNEKEDSMGWTAEYSAKNASSGEGCNVSTVHSSEKYVYVNNVFEAPICKEYDITEKSVYLEDGTKEDQQLIRIKHYKNTKFPKPKAKEKCSKQQPKNSQEDPLTYTTWSDWFCRMACHLFYVDVDLNYIEEPNAEEFAGFHPNYEELISIMQDEDDGEPEELVNGEYKSQHEAYSLYGMMHSKYLLTNDGLEAMKSHYLDGRYGVCLNADCKFQRRIPCGKSKKFNAQHVVLYCPCCKKLYRTRDIYRCVDGAHFGGIEFLSAFFGKFPELINSKGTPLSSPRKTKLPEKPSSPDDAQPKETPKKTMPSTPKLQTI